MTIVVTSETGGTAQPAEAVYVPPDRQVHDAGSSTALAEAGVDAPFVADLLSACLAHERCGVHLYRSVAGRTADAELRAQYEHFGDETRDHVERLEQLIAAADGDPQYVSASARATEKAGAGLLESTYLLSGSVDPMTAELAMLEAVMLAEAKDHANWELLAQLAAAMTDGDAAPAHSRPSPPRCSPRRRSTTGGRTTPAPAVAQLGRHRQRRPGHVTGHDADRTSAPATSCTRRRRSWTSPAARR